MSYLFFLSFLYNILNRLCLETMNSMTGKSLPTYAVLCFQKVIKCAMQAISSRLILVACSACFTPHLKISYYDNFLGRLGSNGFQLKWRFGTHVLWLFHVFLFQSKIKGLYSSISWFVTCYCLKIANKNWGPITIPKTSTTRFKYH